MHNVAAALRNAGRDVEILPFSALARIVAEDMRPRLVVIFRAPYVPEVEDYFAHAQRHGIRTVYDADDLIFNSSIVPLVHGYHLLSQADRAGYRDGVERYRLLMERCDLITTTTEALAQAASALGVATAVLPNSWNEIQGSLAEQLLRTPRTPLPDILVGYFSGSRTHDRDFLEAAPALLRLMRQRTHVRLRIVGELELWPEFSDFGDKVERLPFLPYQDMLRSLNECQINLAPLEVGNPFNEAKSELKWFEAALVEVPTIASATAPYCAAIEDGRTGFIARTEEDWSRALVLLADNPTLRRAVGAAARAVALRHFGPSAVREAAEAAYGLAPPTSPAVTAAIPSDGSRRLRIDWIVPGLIIGSGGHRNIFRAAYYLERIGHDVGLHFCNTVLASDTLRDQLHTHFYPFEGEVRRHDGIMRYSDALMATHWSTVGLAQEARGLTREVMYFVQDFEPLFEPMGTGYILAENTYRQGLYCITSGPWCERVLRREFAAEADHFEFPLDRAVYFPRPRQKDNLNVIFFARPEMPRRCYDLGIRMLRELHLLMPRLEIIMFGSKNVDPSSVGFPASFQAVVPTIGGLAQMYSDADLGIAFSTTNPSLVPYEMMACGLPVVDLGRPGNEANYADRFDIALLANPEPQRMAT